VVAKSLVLFEISELALYTIERELSVANIDVYPILGSVNDTKRLLQVLKHIGPFSLICLVNSGITEPLEPNTLPKRTIVN
jgi:hypothetical protein